MSSAMKHDAFRVRRCAMPGVHAIEACSTHSFPRHTHDQFGIGLIRAGAQRSMSGRGMVEAGPGMVITVNPGEVHDGLPLGEGGRSWNMLYFDPGALQDIVRGLGHGDGQFEFHHPVFDTRGLSRRFTCLYHAMAGAPEDVLAAEETAFMLLSWVVPSRPAKTGCGTPGMDRARSRIDDGPADAVGLAELAGLCGMNRFQFLRSFTRATGLTPHAYLVQRRLELARRLIVKGLSLAQAAADSGFFDQGHMTRHFTRVFGITPGAYATATR